MKAFKKILLLLFASAPLMVKGQFVYQTNGNAITIVGYYDGNGSVAVIPSAVGGLPVTCVGSNAFFGSFPDSVTVPGSVTKIQSGGLKFCIHLTNVLDCSGLVDIESYAFEEDGLLASIHLADSVTNIADHAFAGCNTLSDFTLPADLVTIGDDAFYQCPRISDIVLPAGLTSIGQQAFYDCVRLPAAMGIPGSVTNIGDGAFQYCTNTKAFYFEGNVPAIGTNVFYGDNDATVYYSPGTPGWSNSFAGLPAQPAGQGLTYTTNNGTLTVSGYTGTNGFLIIPSTYYGLPVVDIENAFRGNTSLGSVVIPNSVLNIGDYSFFLCKNLTNVIINPAGLTNIGYVAFLNCVSLPGITLPNSLVSIGSSSFWGAGFTNIVIPPGVVNIPGDAFLACSNLVGLTFLGNVTNIDVGAFQGCALTNPVIPKSVINIGNYAFNQCSNLVYIDIPAGVVGVGQYAFHNCIDLEGIFFGGNPPELGASVFGNDNLAIAYYLPGTTGWSTFSSNVGIPAVLWNPFMQTGDGNFGPRNNRFGFDITASTNIPIVVEASTNLAGGQWTALQACTVTNGSIYFSDPAWTNYPGGFYRVRSP